jgi:hypothetical protein
MSWPYSVTYVLASDPFDCCQTPGIIARKIVALPSVLQQAAPGNVSTRGLAKPCSIVRVKWRRYRWWHLETFTGVACRHTRTPNKSDLPLTRGQLRTVESGSPPGGGRAHLDLSSCHLSSVISLSSLVALPSVLEQAGYRERLYAWIGRAVFGRAG